MTDDLVNDMMADKKPDTNDEIRIQLRNQSFIQLMRTRDGRRFVWWQLEISGFTGQPFTGQRETTDFNCGNRNMGIWLFSMIDQFCPDYFSIMMKESKEDYNDHGRNTSSSQSGSGSTSSATGSGSSGGGVNASDSIAVINNPSGSVY